MTTSVYTPKELKLMLRAWKELRFICARDDFFANRLEATEREAKKGRKGIELQVLRCVIMRSIAEGVKDRRRLSLDGLLAISLSDEFNRDVHDDEMHDLWERWVDEFWWEAKAAWEAGMARYGGA